jgi:hypothetical protein
MGFVTISGSFVVPYIVKSPSEAEAPKKFVPQSMVEQTAAMMRVERISLEEWDISYLKMLFIYAGMDHISLSSDDVLCCLDNLEWDLSLCPLAIEECSPHSSYGSKDVAKQPPQETASSSHHHLSPMDTLTDPWLRNSTASSPNTTLRSLHQVSHVDIGGIVLTAINLKSYSTQQAVFVAEVVKNLCPGVSILTVHHILEKILQAKLYDYSR